MDNAKADAEFQHVQALDGFRQFRAAKEELEALKKQIEVPSKEGG